MKRNIKIPIRTCIGCQEKKPKKELLRIVRTIEGNIEIDLTGKKSGRGAYLCRNLECLEKSLQGKRFNQALNQEIPLSIIEELKKIFQSKLNS